ncbi:hypothetical protein BH09BAC5_BH09BAC5_01840 [soil metagenome]
MKIFTKISIPALIVFALSFSTTANAFSGNESSSGDWTNANVFIENRGQFPVTGAKDPNVLYAYDNGSILIYFKRDGFSYALLNKTKNTEVDEKEENFKNDKQWRKHEEEESRAIFKRDDIFINWSNSNKTCEVIPEGKVNDYYNYEIKDDEQHRHSINNIPAFTKLIYKNIYNNIDLVFEFKNEGGIKYSCVVRPGGNPADIKMNYSGMNKLTKNSNGEMVIVTRFGNIIDHAPVSFYADNNSEIISSSFVNEKNSVGFYTGNYDANRTIIIDPWQLTSGLGFGNSNKVWECEHDNSANSYFWGGDTPVRLKKYNSAGALQWTYNTPWDTANFWIGTLLTDNNGVSYCTGGSNGEISKVSTAGGLVWHNNPNGLFGPIFEYWHMAFNCDQTSLVIGGMRAPNPFSISNYRGVIISINMGSGAVTSFATVGWIAGLNIKEVRSICTCPSGGYYFVTLDSIGYVNSSIVQQWKISSGNNFSYGNPSYAIQGNMGMSGVRANANYLYTVTGSTVQRRNISTGAIINTAPIPGGISSTFLGNSFGCSGLDLDSCGNVYVGSGGQIVKYDASLTQLSTQATPSVVYDVSVTKNGEVVACGNGFMGTYNMGACNPMQAVCITLSTLNVTSSSTNISCNGQCTGSATVSVSGGTAPYTYAWAPSGGNAATASSLCVGNYTCTITDNVGTTSTASFAITQPTAVTATTSQTNLSCNAACNGTASVVASGGTPGYSYSWAPSGGTSATANGLCATNYTCTITDANNCPITKTFLITQPTAISASATSTQSACSSNTGTATVNASGGTGGFTYNWTPSGGTGITATGLAPGSYTCTVTDANGCTNTATVNVSTLNGPSATLQSQANVLCNGGNTGSATVNVTGGSPGYTYVWSPTGGNAATGTGLSNGSYTCTITDAAGCVTTQSCSITQPAPVSAALQSQTNVLCNGGNTGTATVLASGGTPGYTYSWSPSGGSAATGTGLSVGTYTCTITDANGCIITQSATITEPTIISGSATSTPTGCSTSTGSATVIASGGVGSYTYSWSPSGGNGSTATNLSAGIYTVTITDSNGCSATATANVSSTGGPVTTVASSTDVLCNGASTGSGSVNATGNSPFTYAWSPTGGTAATATGLAAGTYSVSVTDAGGCVTIQTLTITEPTPLVSAPTSTPATCGNANGTADAGISGGTGPYTYLWSNSATTATLSGVIGGTYSVTVTDANGCSIVSSVVISNTGAPSVTVQSSTDVLCFGGTTGAATVNVTGGTAPYTYSWSPSGGTGASATNLSAGTYTVTVTGSDGCSQTQILTITAPTAIALTTNSSPENCGDGDGSASVSSSGGTPGYTYVWSNAATSDSISNLNAGSYTVTATDANGCTSTSTVVVANTGTANADAGLSVTITSGQSTQLNGTGGVTYSWSPSGSLSCSNCQNPIASPTVTTVYTLTITDANGCTDMDTVTIYVDIICGEVYMPNAFSPNGDNQNDVFYVRGKCIKTIDLQIYNRWGEKVFETQDVSIGWDGTWRGVACEPAVFTYVLRGSLLDGSDIDKKGNISLVK